MENADIQKGMMLERQRIIDRLEYGVREIRHSLVGTGRDWELVAEFLGEEIAVIKSNEH